MDYICETTIDRPVAEVAAAFEDRTAMRRWQPTLVGMRTVSGTPNQVGSVSQLNLRMGKRELTMTETVEVREPPRRFVRRYEAPRVWNRVIYVFEPDGPGKTRMKVHSEYRFSGIMRYLARLTPGMFRKSTDKLLADFRDYVEGE